MRPLESLRRRITELPGLQVSIRGTERARFLYVYSSLRSVEATEVAMGFWLEYREGAKEESDAESVRGEFVFSESEAFEKIKLWCLPPENRSSAQ